MLCFGLLFLQLSLDVVVSQRSGNDLVDTWFDSLSFKNPVGVDCLDCLQSLLLNHARHLCFDVKVHQVVLVFVKFVQLAVVCANC